MRNAFEKRGFFCETLLFNAKSIGRLQKKFDHSKEPIYAVAALPKELRNGDAFTIAIKHLGNAPVGNFLQSFEIRGKGDTDEEIILLSNIIGLVIE